MIRKKMTQSIALIKHLTASVLLLLSATSLQAQVDSLATGKDNPKIVDYSQPKRYVINTINVSGIKYANPEMFVTASGLNLGDTILIPGDHISDAIQRLWNQRYFSDVQILIEPIGTDRVNIELVLKERPLVYNWTFEGARKGEIAELLKKLKLRRGTELSDYVAKTTMDQIKAFYDEKGFRNVTVELKQVPDTTTENGINVVFNVNRGERVKIKEIVFNGNTEFSNAKLRKSFKKTHQKSINFIKSAKFKASDYKADKENLIDFYNSKGYRNALILSDSIYNIGNNRIGIALTVDEGNKFYYRNIKWLGNSKFETGLLSNVLGIKGGDAYDRQAVNKRLGVGKNANPDDLSVSSLYMDDGYLFFDIEPEETIVGTDSIDMEIKIVEGKQAVINKVEVTGNIRVNDHVIRRELTLRPGELYNRSILMQTMRQISQMGHFNAEAVMPNIQPISNELVDISFKLEEQPSDKVEISGGWGADMFVGSIGLELNNLSIKSFFKKKAWRPYPCGDSQQLKIRAQTNGSYYKALSLSFTEPWLGGKKPNSMTVGLYYTDETDAYYVWQKGTKHFRTIGFSLGFGRRLSWPDPYFQIYNELSYQAYNLKDWDYFIMKNGTSNIISLKTVFSRNSIDQQIFPRTGSEFSVSLTLTPPYSLFDHKNYKDPKLPDNKRYNWIEYHKWQFKTQWFTPIIGRNVIFMAKAELGFLGNYNKNKPSPFEGFDVGGDGMSGYNVYGVEVIGLRGYENGSLTPQSINGDYARAYNKYTMEVRVPFILKPSSQIYGLVFAEGGNAFTSIKTFNPFLIKRSLGFGVRMYLPIVGMMGIDWGYGFDKVPSTGKKGGSQVHFMIGMPF